MSFKKRIEALAKDAGVKTTGHFRTDLLALYKKQGRKLSDFEKNIEKGIEFALVSLEPEKKQEKKIAEQPVKIESEISKLIESNNKLIDTMKDLIVAVIGNTNKDDKK